MNYKQPDFYKFNKDSIQFISYLSETLASKKELNIVDLCTGCGVLGIELSLKTNIEHCIFIEKQKEFASYLKDNIENIYNGKSSNIIWGDFSDVLDISSPIDILIANPPYFIEEYSRQSPNNLKNNCRQWEYAKFISFIETLKILKQKKTEVYFIGRENKFLNDLVSKKEIWIKEKFSSFEVYTL